MTTEAQRIAIAEACKWSLDHINRHAMYYVPIKDCHVGDPLKDLNAMHEAAETVQTKEIPAVDLPRLVRPLPAVGDYVLATKYGDGDPQDHWCVGFYSGLTNPEKYDPPRYDVAGEEGKNFRGNGFRRIKKITPERGAWMLKHAKDIELSGRSVWHFARCLMNPLPNAEVSRGDGSASQPPEKS